MEPFFTDALGRSYAQKENPRRIVSLSPAITEILFAIGAGEKVVGVTQYCDFPPEARRRTSVGGFSGATMSMEKIRFLKPDLVILSADMHARIVSLLDELGIPSFAVEPRNLSQVYSVIALMGELCGCGSGAEATIAEMKGKIARVEERFQLSDTQGSPVARPAVFWLLSEEPLMTAGGETFISEAIDLGGGRNIFADIREQWPLVSPEQVLLRKPDWVFLGSDMANTSSEYPGQAAGHGTAVLGAGTAMPGRLLTSPLWQTIPAVREGQVALVNGDLLYRYGPRLADAVVLIAQILYAGL